MTSFGGIFTVFLKQKTNTTKSVENTEDVSVSCLFSDALTFENKHFDTFTDRRRTREDSLVGERYQDVRGTYSAGPISSVVAQPERKILQAVPPDITALENSFATTDQKKKTIDEKTEEKEKPNEKATKLGVMLNFQNKLILKNLKA